MKYLQLDCHMETITYIVSGKPFKNKCIILWNIHEENVVINYKWLEAYFTYCAN